MTNQKDRLISQELAKKLWDNGCRIESEKWWVENVINGFFLVHKDQFEKEAFAEAYTKLPAYDLLWDICVDHARDFFGEDWDEIINAIFIWLKQGNKEAAEGVIWTFCKFNPDNK